MLPSGRSVVEQISSSHVENHLKPYDPVGNIYY